jgi:hypothetical protein
MVSFNGRVQLHKWTALLTPTCNSLFMVDQTDPLNLLDKI